MTTLKRPQMVTGDKCIPWGAGISGATSLGDVGGAPNQPPLAAVLMWTTDEVSVNRAVKPV